MVWGSGILLVLSSYVLQFSILLDVLVPCRPCLIGRYNVLLNFALAPGVLCAISGRLASGMRLCLLF